ncbi:MAG: hypothetical protein ACK5XG_18980, partial [Burkholderiales bacterium]
MTAATFEDATTLEGAPRPLVQDAWVALNRRYAIGAAALAAALLLLWALGMGPGATGTADAPAGTAQRAADVPAAARPATGTPLPAASPGVSGAASSGAGMSTG